MSKPCWPRSALENEGDHRIRSVNRWIDHPTQPSLCPACDVVVGLVDAHYLWTQRDHSVPSMGFDGLVRPVV